MSTREELIAEAYTWLDTPFRHQGRTKGIEADCAGFVIESARAKDLTTFQITDYSAQSDEAIFNALLRQHLNPVSWRDRLPGDVLSFAPVLKHQHLGLLVEPELFLHAYGLPPCKVITASITTSPTDYWRRRLRGVWRFPEFC